MSIISTKDLKALTNAAEEAGKRTPSKKEYILAVLRAWKERINDLNWASGKVNHFYTAWKKARQSISGNEGFNRSMFAREAVNDQTPVIKPEEFIEIIVDPDKYRCFCETFVEGKGFPESKSDMQTTIEGSEVPVEETVPFVPVVEKVEKKKNVNDTPIDLDKFNVLQMEEKAKLTEIAAKSKIEKKVPDKRAFDEHFNNDKPVKKSALAELNATIDEIKVVVEETSEPVLEKILADIKVQPDYEVTPIDEVIKVTSEQTTPFTITNIPSGVFTIIDPDGNEVANSEESSKEPHRPLTNYPLSVVRNILSEDSSREDNVSIGNNEILQLMGLFKTSLEKLIKLQCEPGIKATDIATALRGAKRLSVCLSEAMLEGRNNNFE